MIEIAASFATLFPPMEQRDVRVVTATGEDLTESEDETGITLRQIVGAFSQLEKTRLVKKLRAARDRMSADAGHTIEGRKG